MNMEFPRRALIAPCSNLRQIQEITFHDMEEVMNAQRARYEIVKWIEEISYICPRCGAKHYKGRYDYCCEFDDMGGNDL